VVTVPKNVGIDKYRKAKMMINHEMFEAAIIGTIKFMKITPQQSAQIVGRVFCSFAGHLSFSKNKR
jgi:hypothetical protein